MLVLALRVDLRIPTSRSLKEKRRVLRPITDGLRARFEVSVAETDHQDEWQRATVGIALVSGEVREIELLADRIERWVWAKPDIEILEIARTWLEPDD